MTPDPTDWFRSRTYRIGDFSVPDLVERKQAAGHTVSVVLPARDEAPTVAGVVRAVRELEGSLVDETIVVDAASTDGTAGIAAQAGAVVHQERDLLPDFGDPRGKGDALWRGLSVTSGDIVVFVDTDIRNPDPRFVWGLLGPLLTDPDVHFVKAFYERPLELETGTRPSGGGRVTELMARPAINLLWPHLAGVVQPLSGEYAGRRDLLRSIPFMTGYGVELGLLIDIEARHGLDAMAQVDLLERVHRNQPLESLSRMAYGILQTVALRLTEEDRAQLDLDEAGEYLQFTRSPAGVRPTHRAVQVVQRPPLDTLDDQPSASSQQT